MFKNETTRNRISIALIILMALILIAIVIWEFDKRIHRIENRGESAHHGIEQKMNLLNNVNEILFTSKI